MGDWTFFSNHGHVLVCLARDPQARLRDVAGQVGITERAVQKIVRDLQDEGYLEVSKHGRRNRYRINNRKALRHQLQSGCTVGQLLGLLRKPDSGPAEKQTPQEEKTEPPDTPGSRAPEQGEPEPGEMEPSEPEPEATPDEAPTRQDLEQGQLF